jgi:pimeloyl-ACP methyl ester carboxylesterase
VRQHLLKQSAERHWKLMTAELGYKHFAAGGGDGGSPISQLLAVHHPESIIGLHLTDIGFHATMGNYSDLSEAEQQYLGAFQTVGFQEGAYAMMLGTKPQTFAYGLNDSPVGWAALVIEKFRSWSDCDGDVEKSFTKDELLTNIMLYWVNDAIDPRGYREEWVLPSLKPDQQIDVPVGLAHPPKDINPVPPREFAERNLKNIQRWTILPRGGHFVAMEDPESMATDIRAFFHDLKAKKRA